MAILDWDRYNGTSHLKRRSGLPHFYSHYSTPARRKTSPWDVLVKLTQLSRLTRNVTRNACILAFRQLRHGTMTVSRGLETACQGIRCHSSLFVRSFHTFLMVFLTATITYKESTEVHKAVVEGENWLYGTAFYLMVLVSIVLYFIACFVDPGYVPLPKTKSGAAESEDEEEYGLSETHLMLHPSQQDQEPSGDDEAGSANSDPESPQCLKLRRCGFCGIEQPLRARHCEECQRCIRRYDHHCPWLGTCVGEGNHRWFWAFLLVTSAIAIWAFLVVIRGFEYHEEWSEWLVANLLLLVDAVIIALGGIPAIGLVCMHSYVMVCNTTTWETVSKERITYLRDLEYDINPFHEGYCRNMWHFLCLYTHQNWERLYKNNLSKIDSRYRK